MELPSQNKWKKKPGMEEKEEEEEEEQKEDEKEEEKWKKIKE